MRDLYIQLRITRIIQETPDAFTYHFESADGKPVKYLAGQFLTFLVQLRGTGHRRSYSLQLHTGYRRFPGRYRQTHCQRGNFPLYPPQLDAG